MALAEQCWHRRTVYDGSAELNIGTVVVVVVVVAVQAVDALFVAVVVVVVWVVVLALE